jgi:hypothetical protein
VRSRDAAAVAAALEPLLTSGLAWVSPSANGWVGVYPESTEKQDPREMESLGSALSSALEANVLGVLVHDSDVLRLWTFSAGKLVDEFDSNPDYIERAAAADRERLKGQPAVLAAIGPTGVSAQAVADALAGRTGGPEVDEAALEEMKQRLLAKLAEMKKTQPRLAKQFEGQVQAMLAKLAGEGQPVVVEGRLQALAAVLGIPEGRALMGYNDVESGHSDSAGFVLLPEARALRRKTQREAQAQRRAERWDVQRRQGELAWAYELPRRRGRDPLLRVLGFAPDGGLWLGEAADPAGAQSLVVLDADGRESARHRHEGLLWTSMSPDGTQLAAITGPRRPIVLRLTRDLSIAAELPPTPRGLGAVHLSREGPYVAVDDYDGTLTFYRLPSADLLRKADIRGANVRSCGWSPDGTRFARIDGGDVIVSNLTQGGDTLVRASRHGIHAFTVCHLPDSQRLLVAGDGGAGVFSPEGELVRRISWSIVGPERAELFDRMAQHLGGSKTSGSELARSQPQLAQSGRAVAATTRWLAVLGADGIVRLWSAETGEALGRRDTQQGLLWDLIASPAGDRLVSGGNPVLCWRIP